MRSFIVIVCCLAFASFSLAADKKPVNRKGLAFFENKIRPVLVKHCYQCHSAKAAANGKLKGALRLDTRGGLLKGGDSGPALVPGKPDQGLLISALKHDAFKMPPKGKLPAAIIADFVKWIKMGAPDPRDGGRTVAVTTDFKQAREFWSFRPLQKAKPPQVRDKAWVRNPIDLFVRARQEAKKLTPNAVAAPAMLVRRVYFDLIGLPPSPAQITQFAAAARLDFSKAYGKLIDELLHSKHFGEKWARHWLDVARYAESNGYAFDGDRPNAFQFRDFVIRALNNDLPYDQFVRLQIAGDLIAPKLKQLGPKPGVISQMDAYAATGFIVAGPFTTQQTMKERERSRYEQLDDMIHTIGTSMLGLTVGCARCHSHKYDPLPQRDYYRVAASFADVGFTDVGLNLQQADFQKRKAAHDKLLKPLVDARSKYEKGGFQTRLKSFLKNGFNKKAALKFGTWYQIGPFTAASFDQAFAGEFPPQKEKVIDLKKAYGNRKWVAQPKWVDGKVHNTLTGTNSANYLYRTVDSDRDTQTKVFLGKDDAIQVWLNGKQVLSKKSSGGVVPNQEKLTVKLRKGTNHFLMKIVNAGGPSGFYFRADQTLPAAIVNLLKIPQKKWNKKQRDQVVNYVKTTDKTWRDLNAKVVALQKKAPKPVITGIFAAKTKGKTYQFGGNTYKVYFLNRGNVDSKQGQAKPGFLRLLSTSKEVRWSKDKPARLALTDWLVDTRHGAGHLLARVVVNRLWHHHFGRGIVSTTSDFGTRGEQPTHPMLLEFLAAKLVDNGWKLKPIHKLILTSATYMQGTEVSDRNQQIDPDNLLIWRRAPRRLEAEVLRDSLLKVCGKLDTRMYGKGSLNQNDRRRSVYLTVKRSRLIPLLQLFDAPDTMQGVGKREVSTVAPQALALLNSPLVRNLAGDFARQIQSGKQKRSVVDIVKLGYQSALGRSPNKEELAQMQTFIKQQVESRQGNKQATQLAVQDFCHLLLCMNEFVYVD